MGRELLKQINLLYVEDDDPIRSVLSRGLERKVNKLYVAADGEEGYKHYLKYRPDIIVTDIKMPKMSGLEMSKLIRMENKHIPIIVTSAHSESVNFLEAIEMGVSNYLLKPIDKEILLNMLEANAKIVLYEKEQKEQKQILQDVIDLQPSIVFSSDSNKGILFANQFFLDFFSLDVKLNELQQYSKEIYENLRNNVNVFLEVSEDKDCWIDYILEHPDKSFRIRINKDNKILFFQVNTKSIQKCNDKKNIIVVLNEIS